ncbi:MAG TPA: hypothetical protein VNA11_19765 [Pseudonocardia sp.]|nr:hypothetical protein [Pseudonocardia sp.]
MGMPSAGTPADLALQLEALLGQHSVLVADMMRGRIRKDEDFGQAANAAVGRNTDELAAVLGSLIGQQGADEFHRLWADHVTAFFSYSRGLGINDAAVRDEARAKLIEYENEVAEFFSAASQGRLPREGARAAAQAHVGHLLDQADAYAAGDYAWADQLYRDSYNHLFGAGQALAAAVVGPAQAAGLGQPSWRLRSELQRLLGEHVALTVAALRAGATNSPDFPAAGQALNANTGDLTAAIGTLFGAPAGQQFMTLWADHIDQLVAYTAGVAANDEGRREAALGSLRESGSQLAGFLGSATGNTVSSPHLAGAFLAHNEMLTRQVDAFVGKDYQRTHELAGDAYQDMFGLSGQLADAFGESVAARLPQGGAQTGAGGTAGAPGPR